MTARLRNHNQKSKMSKSFDKRLKSIRKSGPGIKENLVPIVAIVVVFIALLGVSRLLYTYLPDEFQYKVSVAFDNESNEGLWITPIGSTLGGLVGPIETRLYLASNDGLTITYDPDDKNLQFLLIEGTSGSTKIMPIDKDIWLNRGYSSCCWPPSENRYTIPTLDQLEDAPAELLPTLEGNFVRYIP